MVEPISDDELQRLRDDLERYHAGNFGLGYGPQFVERLLARLDAAESRAAELQREVTRLTEDNMELHDELAGGDSC